MEELHGFGKRLTEAMRHMKDTGQALGEHLGVSRQTITNWKQDRNRPKAEQIYALCKRLRVSADYLLMGVDHSLSLPALKVATRFDKLTPSQKSQWEHLLEVAHASGPAEFGDDVLQGDEQSWDSKSETKSQKKSSSKRPPSGSEDLS